MRLISLVFFVFFATGVFAVEENKDQESIIYAMLRGTSSCKLTEGVIERFSPQMWFMRVKGHCFGFTSLWLHSKWQQVTYPEKVNSSDHDGFKNTVTDILGTNCDEKNSNECRMHDCENVKRFAFQADVLQQAFSKDDLERAMAALDTGGNKPKIEYSIASLLTLDQLKLLLKENIIHEHKLIYVISYSHVTGLFKDGANYYYYDPNNSAGDTIVDSIDETAGLIFAANDFDVLKPSPLSLVMLSLDGEVATASYPSQKEILARIKPALVGISKYANGWSGLHIATMWGCLESVQYFLDKGIDPDIINDDDQTPLIIAAMNNRIEMAEALLKNGAKVNKAIRAHETALRFAAEYHHDEMIKLLIAYGADPNAFDYDDETALMLVAASGSLDMVNLLLEKGADINVQTDRGAAAIMYAAKKGHVEIVKRLLEQGAKDFNQRTIMYAARNGHHEIVKIFLELGVDPNIMDDNNETPLMVAAENGSVETVKLLLEYGANPNIKHVVPPDRDGIEFDINYHRGETALMYAVGENHREVMQLLLDYSREKSPKIKSFPYDQCIKLLPNSWLVFLIDEKIMQELEKGCCPFEPMGSFFIDQGQCYYNQTIIGGL